MAFGKAADYRHKAIPKPRSRERFRKIAGTPYRTSPIKGNVTKKGSPIGFDAEPLLSLHSAPLSERAHLLPVVFLRPCVLFRLRWLSGDTRALPCGFISL
jgi:hypothetical protein